MALGDLAQFLPTEGGFKRPGQYERLLKAEAAERAQFLSSMDQFYAQLNEAARQFDVGTKEQRRMFGDMMDWRRDMRDVNIGQLALGFLGLGAESYLKYKDITYGYDWTDKFAEELGGWEKIFDLYGGGGGGGGGGMDDLMDEILDIDEWKDIDIF